MKYFGTDGIRSLYGEELLVNAYKLGRALSLRGNRILLAVDGRENGEEVASGFAGGVFDGGGSLIYLGIAPTPALAYATKNSYDFGVEITASHNRKEYNGLKAFDIRGEKLCGNALIEVEKDMDAVDSFCKRPLPKPNPEPLSDYRASFDGDTIPLKLAVDAAAGAARDFAREALLKRGINATFIDGGKEVNDGCGSENPDNLLSALRDGYDLGVAFDGDGDRLLVADGSGVWQGEKVLYVLAKDMKERGVLKGKVVVSEMVNKGLISSLKSIGVEVAKCKVGDSNVYAKLKETGGNLGGEPSGHIIVNGEQADALKNALRICKIVYSNKRFDEGLNLLPEKCFVVPYSDATLNAVNETAEMWRGYLGEKGNIRVRVSGTEPVIRVKVEAVNERLVNEIVADLKRKKR